MHVPHLSRNGLGDCNQRCYIGSALSSRTQVDMDTRGVAKAIRKGDQAAISRLRESEDESASAAGETFREAQIVDMDLDGVDLSNTEWDSCLLDRVVFGAADLEGAYLTG